MKKPKGCTLEGRRTKERNEVFWILASLISFFLQGVGKAGASWILRVNVLSLCYYVRLFNDGYLILSPTSGCCYA